MDGCVGRARELAYLEDVWTRVPIACAVCGRRHLGKTAILKEFTRDKKHIYITGTAGLRSDNLDEINRALSRLSGKKERISDIGDLFPALKRICGKEKIVVIIDRLEDLEENFPETGAYIRNFMNREMNGSRIMLVVCDNDNSVFGRFYYTLELKPMSYLECIGFHPDYTPLQHLMAYAIVGGTPAYQHLFGNDAPEDVIRKYMFDHMSVFSLEAEVMLASETLALGGCTKVLSAMAGGAESIREIATRTGLSSSYCSRLVEDMEHKGLLIKEVSSGLSRRAVYNINSNILRFYHQVVYRYTHMVEFETPLDAYEMAKPDIDRYMEREFKNVCMEYSRRNFEFKFIGKLRKKDDSVDTIVDFTASNADKGSGRSMVARCRLYGEPVSVREYEELVDRGRVVDRSKKVYAMFSGCGFSPELEALASDNDSIRLVTLDDVYRI